MAPDRLTVFGSAASRAVPEGVTYQRLRHPDDVPMAEVLDVEVFDGKLYVIAAFTDGTILHFYRCARVAAWNDGVVRAARSEESRGGKECVGTWRDRGTAGA